MSGVPSQYVPFIEQSGQQYGVPPSLIAATLNQESGFDPNAISPAGAEGIAQFMPQTAASENVNPWDPKSAIPGLAHMLQSGFAQFGSWALSLAAYNAGSAAVQQYGGIPPYKETQNYVSSILSSEKNYSSLDASQSSPSPSPSPNQCATWMGILNIGCATQTAQQLNPLSPGNLFGTKTGVDAGFLLFGIGLFIVALIVMLTNESGVIVNTGKAAARIGGITAE